MKYKVTAELDGGRWRVRVPAANGITQARNVAEIKAVAGGLIEVMNGDESPEIEIEFVLPEKVRAHIRQAQDARVKEDKARARVTAEIRMAARQLRESLPLADVGEVLCAANQTAAQLSLKP
jgi:hypothetical protein